MLENEVESLKATVRSLESKLECVLSFLRLDSTESIDELPKSSRATATSSLLLSDTTHSVSDPGVNRSSVRRNERVQSTTLKDVVLNAIQRDSRTRENRARSISVSGLQAQSGLSDVNNVMQLFSSEFNFQPKIVYCKRPGISRSGHIQFHCLLRLRHSTMLPGSSQCQTAPSVAPTTSARESFSYY